jgi:predicted O-linked N-acetylglucosamine transferase (SPINDLY family)
VTGTPADSLTALVESAARARRAGDPATLLATLARLIAMSPADVDAAVEYARLAVSRGDPAAARTALERAIGAAPTRPEPRILLAQLLLALGDPAGARSVADALLALVPDAEQALALAVEARLRLAQAAEASRIAEAFVARHPVSRPALITWNRALQAGRAPAEVCLAVGARIAELDGSPVDWVLHAMALSERGQPEQADTAITRALRLDPHHIPARWMRLLTPSPLIHPDVDAESRFRAAIDAGVDAFADADLRGLTAAQAELALIAAPRFNRHYLGGAAHDWQRRSGRVLAALVAQALPPATARSLRGPGEKPRIAICSAFLRRHTVTRLFGALIEALDPSEFDLALLAPTDQVDEVTQRLGARARWVESGERSLAEWSATIDRIEPDVLVFPDIGMSSLVEALAARRHAPVQAMLWGHPVTSGLSTMDWFLTADAMERTGAESDYSEQVWRLPGLGTAFVAPTATPEPVPELQALPPGTIVCALPQMAQKLRPAHDALLVELAQAVPELVFAFTPHAVTAIGAQFRARLARALASAGLDPDRRIAVCRPLSSRAFLGLATQADFALDPIDWSGGNTSLELFAHDLPILTLPREAMRSRHTAAMLGILDLPELVAVDEADYLARAIRLARDPAWRESLRSRIRERKSRLYADPRVPASFVEFIRRASAGQLPARASR